MQNDSLTTWLVNHGERLVYCLFLLAVGLWLAIFVAIILYATVLFLREKFGIERPKESMLTIRLTREKSDNDEWYRFVGSSKGVEYHIFCHIFPDYPTRFPFKEHLQELETLAKLHGVLIQIN